MPIRPLIPALLALLGLILLPGCGDDTPEPPVPPAVNAQQITDVQARYDAAVRLRLMPDLQRTGVTAAPWPAALTLIALKQERRLEVWIRDTPWADTDQNGWDDNNADWRLLRAYPFTGYSGDLGPKLREGDRQIPEGDYPLASLNPQSQYHLALRVGYPNAAERARAAADGRRDLGGDIMIHGSDRSVGCIPIGDPAIEDVFILASHCPRENVRILILPRDLSQTDTVAPAGAPDWTADLYRELAAALAPFADPGVTPADEKRWGFPKPGAKGVDGTATGE